MDKILIVEDERHLADGLRFNLEIEGYEVDVVETGEEALEHLQPPRHASAVLLDVMLPGIDGFAVVSELRKRRQFLPVMMLTARGRAEDIVKGFEAGADDYLPKPFQLDVLLARLKSLLRRAGWNNRPAQAAVVDSLMIGDRVVDFDKMELRSEAGVQPLTVMETNLLRYLATREGEIVSRKELLEAVWGVREDTDTRAIDNFIVRLRKYLEPDPAEPRHLVTVRGVGYKFVR